MTGYVLALDSIRGQFLPWRKLCVHVLHILLFGLLYLSLIIVLQLSRLVSPFTKGIFGRVESWTFFGTAQKMCLVSARKQVYYGLLDNACQAKVGQRTYKQLLVIIIILSLFSPLHDDDAEENWLCSAEPTKACKYLDTPSWLLEGWWWHCGAMYSTTCAKIPGGIQCKVRWNTPDEKKWKESFIFWTVKKMSWWLYFSPLIYEILCEAWNMNGFTLEVSRLSSPVP